MEAINRNIEGMASNTQLTDRAILSVTPIVIALTLTTINTENINIAVIQWIIGFFVAAFCTTIISITISTIKLHKDNTQYLKQQEEESKKTEQPQGYKIKSNQDLCYWIILILHFVSLSLFLTAVCLIPFSPKHQPKKEITMSNKNPKEKPQGQPTEEKMIPDKDRIIEKGYVPPPTFVEPDRTDQPPEETPETTPTDNPPPTEEPEKE